VSRYTDTRGMLHVIRMPSLVYSAWGSSAEDIVLFVLRGSFQRLDFCADVCAYGSALYPYCVFRAAKVGNMVGKVELCLSSAACFMWGESTLLVGSK